MRSRPAQAVAAKRRSFRRRCTWAGLVAAALAALASAPSADAATCVPPPGSNEIVVENCKQGNPADEWDVSGAGDPGIQGFATDISVAQGGAVDFKIDANASYTLDIYRLGYYGGDGARKVDTVGPVAAQNQPLCTEVAITGLVECSNWAVSASWSVPADAVSGIYLAVPKRGGDPASHIVFVVRDDDGGSDLLFQTSDTTWQAYNAYGGNSLYTGSPDNRAYKVSYDRPFTTRDGSDEDWVFNAEYPMVRWLEANGYDVSYSTGVDSDRRGAELHEHRAFLSVGHDEYWSGAQRANVEAARDAGVNLAFFSGNEVFWKTRWEDGHRTLVTYKETHANEKIDPQASVWTGTWRDPRPFNPEGGRPENALTGTIFTVNAGSAALRVPAEDGRLRLWRGTDVAEQLAGGVATLAEDTVGYEWDEDLDNGARPAGLVRLSSTTVDGVDKLQDYGSTYGPGTATHALTLYRDTNGAAADALVFGAGTVQWPWGLDSNHDRGSDPVDPSMQQATVNLLADMSAQSGSLQPGLAAAAASTDFAPPTVTITSPAGGTPVESGTPIAIAGTATDAGGRVGAVEVSVDDGTSWHPASGRETWTYTWTPHGAGPVTLRVRAADDSGNLGAASTVSVTVGGRMCPCSLFGTGTPADADASDNQPIEVGVRFRSDVDGFITALRYHKGSGWTGTRVGHLWEDDDTLLATAAFTGESASGWQQVALSPPVAVSKDVTYVASYFSSDGSYAADEDFFTSPFDAAPLHAPSGTNGVFVYGGGFPTQSDRDTNYWADVVFEPTDTTPPTVTAVAPADGSVGVSTAASVSATFDEPVDASTVTSGTIRLRDDSGAPVPASVGYAAGTRTATLTPSTPLVVGRHYTATVTTGVEDAAGNALAQARSWSFSTAAASTDPEPPPGGEPFDRPPVTAARGAGTAPGDAPGPPGVSPADRLAPRVRVTPRRARVSRNGAAKLRIACPQGEQRCRIRLRLRLARRDVASRTVTLSGGDARSVKLKLNARARRALARRGSLRVTAVATARDLAGNRATTRRSIQLVGGPTS